MTTVLHLSYSTSTKKYYIRSQNDLYQINEIVRYFWVGGFLVVWVWQFFATLVCLLAATLFWPVTWFEENASTVENRVELRLDELERRAVDFSKKVEGAAMPENVLMGKENREVNPSAITQ